MKKGFTLIELLAVIVILTIIALIATPMILNMIDNTKRQAFYETINGLVRDSEIESALKIEDEMLYKYEKGNWVDNQLNIEGEMPEYVEMKINKEGHVRYAIHNGEYCAIKEYDGDIDIKKIASETTDKTLEKKYCKLDAIIATKESCFKYTVSNNEVTITGYYSYEGNNNNNKACPKEVIVPQEIEELKVTSIANAAFRFKGLKEVVLLEGITTIGGEAFADNKIEKLTLPKSLVTIPANTFRNNSLPQETAYIYKRNSDGSIDYSTLIGYGGKSKNIEIPSEKNGVKLTTIAGNAFYSNGLTSVVIPNTVTTIGVAAFRNNSLTEVILPEGITTIGGEAFADNKIEKLTLPKSLVTIPANTFRNNSLPQETAYIYKRNSDGSIDYSTLIGYGGKSKNIEIPSEKNGVKLLTIARDSFYNNGLTSVVIPNTVTTIEVAAFRKNNLTEVIIPNSVKQINGEAFADNPLTSVTINNLKENVTIASNSFRPLNIDDIDWES